MAKKRDSKEQKQKKIRDYIRKHKKLPSQTTALGVACAGLRHRAPSFKKETDTILRQVGGVLQRDAAAKKRQEILAYIKKAKRLPSPNTPLGAACCRFRFHDPKFKQTSNAALKKAGGMLQREAAQKKRKTIITYIKKHHRLPPQRTELGWACANYRALDPKFKREVTKLLKGSRGG